MNLLDKPSADQERAQRQQTAGSAAETADLQRNTQLKQQLQEMFFGRAAEAGDAWTPGMVGSEGPQSQDAYANLIRAAMGRNLMGLTSPTGTSLTGQQSSQGFLQDRQSDQNLMGSAESLAEAVLAKWGTPPPETKRVEDISPTPSTEAGGVPYNPLDPNPGLGF